MDSVLFPVLAIANAVGTWFLASYLMASFGWRRLASAFRVARGPSGSCFGLAYLGVDAMQYSGMGMVRATVATEGLGLRVLFLFRVGHPPLLLPWSALGPVVVTRSWWRTSYEVSVRVSEQRSVRLRLRDQRLYEALQLRRG